MAATVPSFPFRIDFPAELPISARAEEITATIQAHPVVVLAGETGSGKTTQIPKMCLAAGRGVAGRIACTQPRRVAALSVSRRVAEELGVTWGKEVGCKVRFSDQTTSATRIKFLTDGMLLSEAQGDPLLREYDTIIVDEAHERSLNIDFLLGHLRQLRTRRPDLKVIVTSATIDTAAFSEAFGGAPVVIVEGRTYPVEVIYAPLDSFGSDADPESVDPAEKAEALHYIDGTVEAVERILRDSASGDILVFQPSERDVREVKDQLEGRSGNRCDVVPLFGRLSNAEQQRVFAPSQRRKIVVATNIAETSLTIPGIRFVVDTGLARVSRYTAQARTRRLPIEEISQSSADQRKGRCGRVAEGVCIRLFSEEDFLARPRYSQPEIQRANLADVILRLKAFGFGEVESFPFLSPPAPKAIRAGYGLLEELGAIDPANGGAITQVGRDLARLPVDPTVGRMIFQARTEKAVREVLVIAAGLSIQDPRERPMDKQAQADAAHRRFAHPDSDFLTLLNIWQTYHDKLESMSQAGLRRFCRDHFLSYTRMREWRDIHGQLADGLRERRDFRPSSVFDGLKKDEAGLGFATAGYRAIHRSILSGLLGNIAVWDPENSVYKATNDRRVALFPGSVLFKRPSAGKKAPSKPGGANRRPPAWIMAAEIVETTRIFARTCARLDPAWAMDLGAHLVRIAHSEPFWDEAAGRVKAKQKTRLYGLEIDARTVSFGKINPALATEIFIREGLVNDTIAWPFDFLAHNRALREKIVAALTRARSGAYLNLDETLYRFYSYHLGLDRVGPAGLSSVAELVDLARERRGREPRFLFAEENDLHDPGQVEVDPSAFPEKLPLENRALPLQYAYRPGKDEDGVTLEVSLEQARQLTPAALDWAVPGHLGEKVEHYLKSLPKELRRTFVPLAENAERLSQALASRNRLTGGRETVAEALAAEMRERYRLGVTAAIWAGKPPPDHLRVRVSVRDPAARELAAGRDLEELHLALGMGLKESREAEKVRERSRISARLAEALRYELGWMERDLRSLRTLGPLTALLAPIETLQADALGMLRDWACAPERVLANGPGPGGQEPVTEAQILQAVEAAKGDLRGRVPRLIDLLREVLTLRQELLVHPQPYPGLEKDVTHLVGPEFLKTTPYLRLEQFPRYLKAMKLRADRWKKNPGKDAERSAQLAPYAEAIRAGNSEVRWLVEEMKVSLFAQELGTPEPVSAVKLDRAMSGEPPKAAAAPKKPAVARLDSPAAGKGGPIKSLSALDKFFPKT